MEWETRNDAQLVGDWRERAVELDADARELRLSGDAAGAAQAEAVAREYRADAERLERETAAAA